MWNDGKIYFMRSENHVQMVHNLCWSWIVDIHNLSQWKKFPLFSCMTVFFIYMVRSTSKVFGIRHSSFFSMTVSICYLFLGTIWDVIKKVWPHFLLSPYSLRYEKSHIFNESELWKDQNPNKLAQFIFSSAILCPPIHIVDEKIDRQILSRMLHVACCMWY